MSFILDALKKSEAARQRQIGPGLIEPGMGLPRRGLPLWAVALLVLLGINLIVLSVILVRHATRAPEPRTVSIDAEASRTSSAAALPAAPVVSSNTPSAPISASTAKPFSPMDDAPVTAPEIPIAPADDTPAAAPQRSARSTRARPQPDDNEEILPTIDALNLRGADALPPLHLDVHVYATNPADRFVYINSRKYSEGSKLPEGPKVERIRRDGVVLNYHGIRFLLPRR